MRYQTTVIGIYPRTHEFVPGSVRVFRSDEPAPCPVPEGTPVPRFSGPLIRVRILKPERGHHPIDFRAGDIQDVPEELAAPRLRDGRMRLARPDERLTSYSIE